MTTNPIALSAAAWSAGIDFELEFWRDWARTRGGRWPEDFSARLQAGRKLDAGLELLLPLGGASRVLDVGAGPVTVLGTESTGRTIHVLAADPLASLYERILAEFDIVPPIRTVFATAEDLSAFFAPSTFDLVHCRNALDHSFDPVRGIEEMLRVVRTGGHVVLRHFINEAECEAVGGQYMGFHQFNFDQKDGRFHIWNKQAGVFPEELMRCRCTFTTAVDLELRSIEVVVRKTREFEDACDGGRFRQRVCDATEGLISHSVSLALDNLKYRDLQGPADDQTLRIIPTAR